MLPSGKCVIDHGLFATQRLSPDSVVSTGAPTSEVLRAIQPPSKTTIGRPISTALRRRIPDVGPAPTSAQPRIAGIVSVSLAVVSMTNPIATPAARQRAGAPR